jgi:chromosomal replication initiator protein
LFRAARQQQAEAGLSPNVPGKIPAERRDVVGPKPDWPQPAHATDVPPVPAALRTVPGSARVVRPRRWRRLEDFVVGPCNRLAHAAAMALVEEPEASSHPLALHGPVGSGKTHLLEGIHAGLQECQAGWRVCYITAEDFTNRFVQAMQERKLTSFRKQFRECDALLLDDLQFLANKPATQEEFLHTLNVMHAEERAVVVTCDCHPRLVDRFQPELVDRLVGGVQAALTLPERQTRLQILRAKALVPDRPPVPPDVLEFIADKLRGNVRELEGALHSLWHYARVHAQPITLDMAREALAELLRHSVRVLQLPDVEQAVCAALGVGRDLLQSKKRGWMASHPRMLAVYLARKHTAATYSEIGQRFGGRNHSTAVAAEKKVRQWLAEDACLNLGQRPLAVRDLLDKIERQLAG